jgi:hypothetical protein
MAIELDRWDSQIVWLAKNWLNEHIRKHCKGTDEMGFATEMTNEDFILNWWSNRCYVSTKLLHRQYLRHLQEIVFNLSIQNSINPKHFFNEFVFSLSPYSKYTTKLKYTDGEGYIKNFIDSCLNALVFIPVREEEKELIIMKPFEPHLLLFGLR